MVMKALIFCGYHNTGKTTLIEKAVTVLYRRGYSVITVKHTPKSGASRFAAKCQTVTYEKLLKSHTHTRHSMLNDTGRLLEAGSRIAIQVTDNALIQYRLLGRAESGVSPLGTEYQTATCSKLLRRQSAASLLPTLLGELDADFALIEGFKSYEGLPRIVFGHTRHDILQLATKSTIAFSGWEIEKKTPLALETGSKIPYIPVDTGADVLADFIERHALGIEV